MAFAKMLKGEGHDEVQLVKMNKQRKTGKECENDQTNNAEKITIYRPRIQKHDEKRQMQ